MPLFPPSTAGPPGPAGPAGPAGPPGALTVTAVKVAPYTAASGELVRCNPTGGAFAVTLPLAASVTAGQPIVVKNTTSSTNAITIARSGADTIDGATSASIAVALGSLTFNSDGVSNWMIT